MLLALTRAVPASINRCELTHLQREPIDYARAVAEHDAYEDCLRQSGVRVQRLPELPDHPDSVFVEDTAVVFDEIAVIARPGAASRRGEVESMSETLRAYRRVAFIRPPGTLDGGDVLVTPGHVFVGISGRTNADGARQLAMHIAPFGFTTVAVPVSGCLHLKSAVTLVHVPREGGNDEGQPGLQSEAGSYQRARATLLINPEWVDRAIFAGYDLIEVDPAEPMAANVLRLGDRLVCAAEHPRTRRRLEAHALVTQLVPAGELARAEGGVTCCSVLVTIA